MKNNILVISDIHLGSPVCRVKSLAKVLKNEKYNHLIINGDLFDNKYIEKYKIPLRNLSGESFDNSKFK